MACDIRTGAASGEGFDHGERECQRPILAHISLILRILSNKMITQIKVQRMRKSMEMEVSTNLHHRLLRLALRPRLLGSPGRRSWMKSRGQKSCRCQGHLTWREATFVCICCGWIVCLSWQCLLRNARGSMKHYDARSIVMHHLPWWQSTA